VQRLRGRRRFSAVLSCAAVAAGSKPIVVIGNLNDPATPYSGAVSLTKELTTGVLLTWDGEGHTSYPQTPSIGKAADAYLINLTLAAPNTTCPRS
jgi:hypothetical protein